MERTGLCKQIKYGFNRVQDNQDKTVRVSRTKTNKADQNSLTMIIETQLHTSNNQYKTDLCK